MKMSTQDVDTSYSETFSIPSHLVGLALGSKYSNLHKVEKLEGITKAVFRNQVFEVHGKDERVVKIARSLLEYCEKKLVYPCSVINQLLANDGNLIKKIIYETGLVRIEIKDKLTDTHEGDDSNFITIILRGTVENVESAQTSLDQLKTKFYPTVFKRREKSGNNYRLCESFKIKKHLVGLSIGKNGHNIRKITDSHDIFIDKKDSYLTGFTEFKIYGNNAQEIKDARAILEIVEDKSLIILKNQAKLVIGKNGSRIKEIMKKSGVHRLDIDDYYDEQQIVKIIGNPEQVRVAKSCVSAFISNKY